MRKIGRLWWRFRKSSHNVQYFTRFFPSKIFPREQISATHEICEQSWQILRAGKNLGKIGKILGILALATDFSVKYVLYSFSIQSVGNLRPQTFLDTINLRGTVVFTIDFCRRQTRCPQGLMGFRSSSFFIKIFIYKFCLIL